MRVAYTAATGKLPPGENPPAALRFALRLDKDGNPEADDIDPETRLGQANKILDRVLGKAPETVTLEGELAISRIVRTIVDPKDNG
jgi:hypothetical protein